MKTLIYSGSTSTTATDLYATTKADVDHWFPEVRLCHGPRCEEEILGMLEELTGTVFVTMSDIVILMFLKEVRDGRMKSSDLKLYCNGIIVDVDSEGEIDYWKDGFFRTRGKLLF